MWGEKNAAEWWKIFRDEDLIGRDFCVVAETVTKVYNTGSAAAAGTSWAVILKMLFCRSISVNPLL